MTTVTWVRNRKIPVKNFPQTLKKRYKRLKTSDKKCFSSIKLMFQKGVLKNVLIFSNISITLKLNRVNKLNKVNSGIEPLSSISEFQPTYQGSEGHLWGLHFGSRNDEINTFTLHDGSSFKF